MKFTDEFAEELNESSEAKRAYDDLYQAEYNFAVAVKSKLDEKTYNELIKAGDKYLKFIDKLKVV